jgi:hypothetical protein
MIYAKQFSSVLITFVLVMYSFNYRNENLNEADKNSRNKDSINRLVDEEKKPGSGKSISKSDVYLGLFQNPVGFDQALGKTGQEPGFSPKSKDAVPKTEVLEQPHLNYVFSFDALMEDEVLSYSFNEADAGDGYTKLHIKRKGINNNTERTIGYWDVNQDNFQMSADKKSGMFFLNPNAEEFPLFIIDGKKGLVSYVYAKEKEKIAENELGL